MAFRYDYFKNLMSTVTAVGGFDKEIELKMLSEGHTIEYLDTAIVLDEKIQEAGAFSNQRRRWLSAQISFFRKDIGKAVSALFSHGNADYFEKTLQFIQPPRILLLGAVLIAATVFSILDLVFEGSLRYFYYWLTLLFVCVLTFLFSIPVSFYRRQTLAALGTIPGAMILMLGSLLRIRGANKEFLHTRHNAVRTDL
jgi:cellulose synthase/poly-beta-1,6-N-acetylglucosamine synthase-like glycosyltransferase